VATAIAKRNVVIADYSEEGLRNPLTLEIAKKVYPVLSKDIKKDGDIYPAQVEIVTQKGVYRQRVDIPYGHPQRPMSLEAIAEKFRDCTSYSAKKLPQKNIEEVIQRVNGLEKESCVGDIVRLLS